VSLAVFVNTSDGYKDCWLPFFQLFDRYGGTLRGRPIYLNTEKEFFVWPGLDVRSTATWPPEVVDRPNWGQRCSDGLNSIEEPYVLYLQEDYFLTCPTRNDILARALSTLENDPGVGVIYLNDRGPRHRNSRFDSSGFVEILPPSSYLVNTQAAIWRKDFLLSLIAPWENVWMFEKFASVRARRRRERFLTVSPEMLAQSPVLDYGLTGVARGKWQSEVVPLFQREGLNMDFSRRGFYKGGRLKFRFEVLARILESPSNAVRSLRSLL
jgi:hypothetical protein